MGGAFLLLRDGEFICFFFTYEWGECEHWHVNVLEAVAGFTLLVAGQIASPAPFVTEYGDNNVANAGARRNATPNLQIARVLQERADYVHGECITTRQRRVSSEDNVLGDPLSRGPEYMSKFKAAARDMGAVSFVRMEIPPLIRRLLTELARVFPEVKREEDERREERCTQTIARGPRAETRRIHEPSLSDLGIIWERSEQRNGKFRIDVIHADITVFFSGSP
jgi:hypothetical protein